MPKPHPRAFRTIFALFLALALSAVFTSSAQSTELAQIAKSLDGQISIRLPAGWQSRDAAAPIFSTVLAFGDSADALQNVIDSLTATTTMTAAHMNGIIGIVQPGLLSGLSGDLAVSTLLNAMLTNIQQTGGTIVQQQSTMIANQYPGSIAIVKVTSENAAGLVGVFQTGAGIVEFTMGASPAINFDSNQEMFFNMLDSISIPAETGNLMPPPVQPTVASVNPPINQTGQGTVVAGASGTFSLRLPQGYVSAPITVASFADTLAYGDSAATEQTVADLFVSGKNPGSFSGIAGIVGAIDASLLNGQAPANLAAPLMQSMLAAIVQTGSVTIVQQPQAHTFGGQYDGQLAELNLGYLGVVYTDAHLLVVLVLSDNVATNRAQMTALLDSIRIPAEAANAPVPTQVAPQPTLAAPAELHTLRSGDNQVSLVIPLNWNVLDHVADGSILTYGNSPDAAMSRLYSVKPAFATETVISGLGGVVVLYPMSQFGIDPAKPDLTALMKRALSNLQGYTVEQIARPLDGTPNALYAIINGTEHGYLALIPFGDQIAYVTATSSGAGDTFAANADALLEIIKSVHVPAAAEPTPEPTASGLGGLGGLSETEATPEATAAGLGGL